MLLGQGLCLHAALCTVHVQTILRGFEAETVLHKQRVDSATENSLAVITEDQEICTHSLKTMAVERSQAQKPFLA